MSTVAVTISDGHITGMLLRCNGTNIRLDVCPIFSPFYLPNSCHNQFASTSNHQPNVSALQGRLRSDVYLFLGG